MNIVEFNKDKIIKSFDEGVESNLYYYNNNEKIVLLKYFKDEIKLSDDTIKIDNNILHNKEKKIEIISSSPLFKNEVKIFDKVYKDGSFKAYTMEKSDLSEANYFMSKKSKIKILKLLKEKIEIFNSNGIFLGDIQNRNILTSKDVSKIELCDLDNFKIGNLDFDAKPLYVNEFNRNCNNKELVDCYAFNLFTVCFLTKVFSPYAYEYLKNNGLPRVLNTKENREIVDSILYLDNSYQKKYLIDNIK